MQKGHKWKEVSDVGRHSYHKKNRTVHFRLSEELEKGLTEAAARSEWSISEQIRFELEHPRGLWKTPQPYLPQPQTVGAK